MSYAAIERDLAAGKTVILDGATGSELERRGAAMDDAAWCGPATLENLDILRAIHRDYITAGAQVITANTFATSRIMLAHAGLADKFEEINRAAVRAAISVRDETGPDTEIAVAGALSHMTPLHAGTRKIDPSSIPASGQLRAAFGELAQLHASEGADLIALEMMYHPDCAIAAFEAAKASGLPFWAGFAVRRGDDGEVLTYLQHADVPFKEMVGLAQEYGAAAAGIMHAPSHLIADADAIVAANFSGPRLAYPDSGFFRMPSWQFEGIISPADFADHARGWVENGVQVIGGCCGLSPEHIAAIAPLRS